MEDLISVQKQKGELLPQSEERYRILVERASDAIFTIDDQGVILFANRAAEAIFGYKVEELLGRRLNMLMPSYFPHEYRAALKRSIETGKLYTKSKAVQFTGVQKGGQEIPLEISFAEYVEDGRTFFTGIVCDVGARKYEQQRLQRLTKERLKLFDISQSILSSLSLDQVMDRIFAALRELLQYQTSGLYLLDADARLLRPYLITGLERISNDLADWTIPLGRGIASCVVESGAGEVVNNAQDDPRSVYPEGVLVQREHLISVPVKGKDKILGVFNVARLTDPPFTQEEFELVQLFISHAAIAIENARLFEELNRSEIRYRELFEDDFTGDFLATPDGQLLTCNEAFANMFGFSSVREARKASMMELYRGPDEWRRVTEELAKRKKIENFESVLLRRDEREVHIVGNVIGSFDEQGSLREIKGYLIDNTKRKQAEKDLRSSREHLRQLAAHLQIVREEERTRISREIHDELGQMLTGLKMEIFWLIGMLRKEDLKKPLLERLKSMTKPIDDAIKTVRRIASELRPGVLDDLGLEAAIEWLTSDYQSRLGIRCTFTSNLKELKLDRNRSTAIFRIFQETMTNIVRHARATRVDVQLKCSRQQILLTVKDNGRGITEPELQSPGSLGILGMRERALQFEGQLSVTGKPGHGTKVTLKIPYRRATKKKIPT